MKILLSTGIICNLISVQIADLIDPQSKTLVLEF